MSRVRFSVYMVATTLGLLPEIVLLCYFGTTLRSLQDLADGNAPLDAGQIIFMVVGVLVSIVLFVILFRLGREAMREMDRSVRGWPGRPFEDQAHIKRSVADTGYP